MKLLNLALHANGQIFLPLLSLCRPPVIVAAYITFWEMQVSQTQPHAPMPPSAPQGFDWHNRRRLQKKSIPPSSVTFPSPFASQLTLWPDMLGLYNTTSENVILGKCCIR